MLALSPRGFSYRSMMRWTAVLRKPQMHPASNAVGLCSAIVIIQQHIAVFNDGALLDRKASDQVRGFQLWWMAKK
jgi:hypothetical protein